MYSVNILDYSLQSSQGNTEETLKSIKDKSTTVSSKGVSTLDGNIEIPYYLFQEKIEENPDDIKQAIKKVVQRISDKLSVEKRKNTSLLIGTALVDKNVVKAVVDTMYEIVHVFLY